MELLQDRNRKWGLVATSLTTPVPLPQQTIVINFGTSQEGTGKIQPEEVNAAPKAENIVQEEVRQVRSAPVKASTEAVTQDNTDAISLKEKKINSENPETEPVKEPERTVNRNALYPGKSGKSKSSTSEGETGKEGDQGDQGGDKNSHAHIGNISGGGDSYQLGLRKALVKTKPRYDCQESGKVAVAIKVDKTGRVVSAQAGGKGTTNSAACLITKAEEAALKTKWEPDENAPELQIGTIIYNFVLN
jgi:hypothetical protein